MGLARVWTGCVLAGVMCCGLALAQTMAPTQAAKPENINIVSLPIPRDETDVPSRGACKVSAKVDATGIPKKIHVIVCTDNRLEKYAAAELAAKTLEPSMHNGKPVSADMVITVTLHTEADPASTSSSEAKMPEQKGPQTAEGVTPPVALYVPKAPFPKSLHDSKGSCSVVMGIVVNRDGVPRDLKVKKSCDQQADANAISTVATWLFKPAMKDGQPVSVGITAEVGFYTY